MSEDNQSRKPQSNRSNNGNRNNRNRNNRNNNRGPRRDGSSSNKRDQLQPRREHRAPAPKPLTFWQKILKAVGLYKPEVSPQPQKKTGKKATKAAKKSGRVAGGGRVDNRNNRKKGENKGGERKTDRKPADPNAVTHGRLYVGNLNFDAAEFDIEELFKGIGSVRKVEVMYNSQTHKSKGYGFVTFGSIDDAKRAIEVLHDQPFMGRKLVVNPAKGSGGGGGNAKRARKRSNSGGGNSGRNRSEGNRNNSGRNRDSRSRNEPGSRPLSKEDIPANEEVHSLVPDPPKEANSAEN